MLLPLKVSPPSGRTDFTGVVSVCSTTKTGEGAIPSVNTFRVSIAPSASGLVVTCQPGINPMIRQMVPRLVKLVRTHFMNGISSRARSMVSASFTIAPRLILNSRGSHGLMMPGQDTRPRRPG
jgi:hypothetical protein